MQSIHAETVDTSKLINIAVQGEYHGNLGVNCNRLSDLSRKKITLSTEQIEIMRLAELNNVMTLVNEWFIPLAILELSEEESDQLKRECLNTFDLEKKVSSKPFLPMIISLEAS